MTDTDQQPTGLDVFLSQLDEEGQTAIRAELKRARDDAAKYRAKANSYPAVDPERIKQALDAYDALEENNKSAEEKLAATKTALENQVREAQTALWRERAARKHKLPESFLGMLTGDSEEDLEAKAASIAGELNKYGSRPADAVPTTPKPSQSPGAADSETVDFKALAADVFRY